MAAQTQPMSIQEFYRLYDGAKPAYEYWFGEAVQKTMPTLLHGIVQLLLALMLERDGWNTALEVRLRVFPEAEPVPNLIAVRGKFKGAYPTVSPELCIEMLSPGDTLPKALEKAHRYIDWGSRSVWLIDPDKRTAWTLSQEAGPEPRWVAPDGFLQIDTTTITLGALFAEVDRKLELTGDSR